MLLMLEKINQNSLDPQTTALLKQLQSKTKNNKRILVKNIGDKPIEQISLSDSLQDEQLNTENAQQEILEDPRIIDQKSLAN